MLGIPASPGAVRGLTGLSAEAVASGESARRNLEMERARCVTPEEGKACRLQAKQHLGSEDFSPEVSNQPKVWHTPVTGYKA